MEEKTGMSGEGRLVGKRVLVVDDEPDISDTLAETLSMCEVTKAYSFDQGSRLLEEHSFDIAILDIMGVRGFELLDMARRKGVIAVMLTGHALSPGNIIRSYREGAASCLPKEEMANIAVFLTDILEARGKGASPWWRWFDRLAALWEKRFGPDWKEEDRDFWEKFPTL